MISGLAPVVNWLLFAIISLVGVFGLLVSAACLAGAGKKSTAPMSILAAEAAGIRISGCLSWRVRKMAC